MIRLLLHQCSAVHGASSCHFNRRSPPFSAITTISSHDYVLVQAGDRSISGIVTANDFNVQFRILAEPFLLVGEIENGVRRMLHSSLWPMN